MKTSKPLQAIIGGMMLAQAGSIDCKFQEKDLLTQYIIIEGEGKATLHRVFLEPEYNGTKKRCKVEYDVAGVEPRGNSYLLHFGEARYYVEQTK